MRVRWRVAVEGPSALGVGQIPDAMSHNEENGTLEDIIVWDRDNSGRMAFGKIGFSKLPSSYVNIEETIVDLKENLDKCDWRQFACFT